MTPEQIREAAVQQRVVPQALDQIVARVQAHFGDAPPSPQALSDYLASLFVWEKLGLTQKEFDDRPLAWRHEQGRLYAPPPAPFHSRRPVYRVLRAEEWDAIKDLPWEERQTKGRELQQTPEPRPDGA